MEYSRTQSHAGRRGTFAGWPSPDVFPAQAAGDIRSAPKRRAQTQTVDTSLKALLGRQSKNEQETRRHEEATIRVTEPPSLNTGNWREIIRRPVDVTGKKKLSALENAQLRLSQMNADDNTDEARIQVGRSSNGLLLTSPRRNTDLDTNITQQPKVSREQVRTTWRQGEEKRRTSYGDADAERQAKLAAWHARVAKESRARDATRKRQQQQMKKEEEAKEQQRVEEALYQRKLLRARASRRDAIRREREEALEAQRQRKPYGRQKKSTAVWHDLSGRDMGRSAASSSAVGFGYVDGQKSVAARDTMHDLAGRENDRPKMWATLVHHHGAELQCGLESGMRSERSASSSGRQADIREATQPKTPPLEASRSSSKVPSPRKTQSPRTQDVMSRDMKEDRVRGKGRHRVDGIGENAGESGQKWTTSGSDHMRQESPPRTAPQNPRGRETTQIAYLEVPGSPSSSDGQHHDRHHKGNTSSAATSLHGDDDSPSPRNVIPEHVRKQRRRTMRLTLLKALRDDEYIDEKTLRELVRIVTRWRRITRAAKDAKMMTRLTICVRALHAWRAFVRSIVKDDEYWEDKKWRTALNMRRGHSGRRASVSSNIARVVARQ
eukprot:GEMP01013464.1.p1 GENE.GEMP01013464.1~~GEMP01013464.1.p1  ORF type:complete len:608 (+),score=171.77 GEMP01013464.1:314-2137(+)